MKRMRTPQVLFSSNEILLDMQKIWEQQELVNTVQFELSLGSWKCSNYKKVEFQIFEL